MTKKQKEKRQSTGFSSYFVFSLLLVLAFLFLTLNVFASQTVSSLFLQVVNNQYQSTVLFLKKIKTQDFFDQELKRFRAIFGKKIENDVFSEDRLRAEKIKKCELLLKKNPDARDVLYQLYLLYQEAGNTEKADEYYRRVKEVDPFLYN
jgi:tetratricopeptide (TPR) repeat protein